MLLNALTSHIWKQVWPLSPDIQPTYRKKGYDLFRPVQRTIGQRTQWKICEATFTPLLNDSIQHQISVNTWEHSSVQVANGPKGSEAAQTCQTARTDRSDRFLGFRRNRSSRGITITLTWWKTVRFASKPAKDNCRIAYPTSPPGVCLVVDL